jgi:hypothetical protein
MPYVTAVESTNSAAVFTGWPTSVQLSTRISPSSRRAHRRRLF